MAKKTAPTTTKKKTATRTSTTKTTSGVSRKATPKPGSKAALRAALLQAITVDDGSAPRTSAGARGVSPEAAITALLELAFDIAEDHDIEISIE